MCDMIGAEVMRMKCLLEQFYDGELSPMDAAWPALDSYRKMKKCMEKKQDEYQKKMTDSERRDFERFMEDYTFFQSFEIEDAYIQGMRMGAQLILELLGGSLPPCAAQQP